jgi:DNA polymerase-3 subunit gamma/tau
LRKRLNNYGIKVEILISEATKEELVYSVNEKYKYLKKLNPSLKELRDRFDLDF